MCLESILGCDRLIVWYSLMKELCQCLYFCSPLSPSFSLFFHFLLVVVVVIVVV